MNVSHRRTAAVVAASLAALAPSAAQAYRVDASYPPQRVDPAPSARVAMSPNGDRDLMGHAPLHVPISPCHHWGTQLDRASMLVAMSCVSSHAFTP